MEDTIFKPGDVVQQKAGGPPMTVESGDDTQCHCMWWPKRGDGEWTCQPETADFLQVTLVKYPGF